MKPSRSQGPVVRVRHETVANQTGKHVLDLVVEQPERKQGGLHSARGSSEPSEESSLGARQDGIAFRVDALEREWGPTRKSSWFAAAAARYCGALSFGFMFAEHPLCANPLEMHQEPWRSFKPLRFRSERDGE